MWSDSKHIPMGTPSKNRINTKYSEYSEDFFIKIKKYFNRIYI